MEDKRFSVYARACIGLVVAAVCLNAGVVVFGQVLILVAPVAGCTLWRRWCRGVPSTAFGGMSLAGH